MSKFLSKTRIAVSTFALAVVLTFIACDKHKNSKPDSTEIIDISVNNTCVERNAKRGIEISKKEHKEIVEKVTTNNLLKI